MAYTPPDKDTFTALFPAFASVEQAAYDFWSAQAALITEPMQDCLGARMDLATMLVTAHYLTQQGIGTGTEAQVSAQGANGFKSIKSGSLSLERADTTSTSEEAGDWGATSYGLRAWPMLSTCAGSGPIVSSTGRVVGSFGYQAGPMPWQRY